MSHHMSVIKALIIMLLLAGIPLNTHAAGETKKENAAQVADGKDLVALDLQLPPSKPVGTPPNIKPSPYLETDSTKPRKPFLAPKGTVNLAKGKTVTSSIKEPITGDLTLVTDDDKSGVDGTYVELDRGPQWVQIDLGQAAPLYAIVIWHFHSQMRVYHDVIVQVSDDPDFIKDVKTLYSNDYDNSAGLGVGKDKEYIDTNQGRLIDAKGIKGRYVRCYSNGNTSNEENHYVEVAVYGKPLK